MRQRYSDAQRNEFFEEQKRTGEPLRAVARRLGIHEAVVYKWVKQRKQARGRPAPVSTVSFAQVVRSTPTACLVVQVGQASIRVPPEFDEEHLVRVVQALALEQRRS